MNNGLLSFSIEGKYCGRAYLNNSLKTGPIYAAVALLHRASLTLESNLTPPEFF
jgi:hypothetical protein